MKKEMLKKSKSEKIPAAEKGPEMDQSKAPKVKPSMKHKEPSAEFSMPKNGEQSMKPDHKKKALPMQDAPKGVAGVNGGSPVAMPKAGGVGESEV